MKVPLLGFVACVLTLSTHSAADRINVAEDEASHSAYNAGWETGRNGGAGFGEWVLASQGGSQPDSHAGFFVADIEDHPNLQGAAVSNRAFGLFANGVVYEAAVAFRTLASPLQVGDSFSLLFECDDFVTKFDSDDEKAGLVGFALRNGSASGHWTDYDKNARFRFGFAQGEGNYIVRDGESSHDTGVPLNPDGVAVTVTLTGPDTYDMEITLLNADETIRLEGRKLAGPAGTPIESFSVFNIDGEKEDVFFNGLQVSRSADSVGR